MYVYFLDLGPDQIKEPPVVGIVVISKVEHSGLTVVLNQPFQGCISAGNSFGRILVCLPIRRCRVGAGEMN